MNGSGSPGRGTLVGWLLAVVLTVPLALTVSWALAGAGSGDPPSPQRQQKSDEADAQRQQRIDERNRLDSLTRSHITAGQLPEAIASALEMLAIEREVFGEQHDDTVSSRRMLAECYALLGNAEEARSHEKQQLAAVQQDRADDDWRVRGPRHHQQFVERILSLDDAQRAELAKAYAAYSGAIRLYQEGQFQESRAAHAGVAETYRKLLGEDLAATAESVAWLGYAQGSLELREEACATLQQAADITRKAYGENYPYEAACLNSIGIYRSELKQYDKAAEAFRRAWDIRRTALGADDEYTRGSLSSLIGAIEDQAQNLEDQGDWSAVVALRREALELTTQRYPPDDWHLASARVELAAAERIAKLGEDERKRIVESKHLQAQASDLYQAGKIAEAIPKIEAAYATRVELLGKDDSLTASAGNLLAILVDDTDFDRGVQLFNETIDAWQAAKGIVHPDVALALSNLAVTYNSRGHLAEAESRYRRALEIYDHTYGPRDRTTLNVVDQLARVLRRRARDRETAEDFESAQADWQQVVELAERRYGKSNWRVTDDRLALESARKLGALSAEDRQQLAAATKQADFANARLRDRKPAEAIEPAAGAVVKRASILGGDDPATNSARLLVAIALRRTGKLTEAAPFMQQVVEAAGRVYGHDHPEYARQLENQGYLDSALGNDAAAADHFREAYHIRQQALGDKDSSTVSTGNTLAEMLTRQADALANKQDYEAARPLRQEAVELRTALAGEDHWRTLDARWEQTLDEEMAQLSADDRTKIRDADAALGEAERLAKEKKYNAAIGAVEKAVRLRKEALGEQHRLYAVARHRLGLATLDRGDVKLALSVLQPNLELIKQTFGPRHPSYAYGLNTVANVLISQGELGRAITLRRQSLEILTAAKGEKDKDTVTATKNLLASLEQLAAQQDAQSDLAPAKATWEEILALRIQLYGEKHWQTNDARWGLYRTQLLPTLSRAKRNDLAKADQWMARADYFLEEQAKLAKQGGTEQKQYQAAQSAEEAARSALALRRKVYGDGNPGTADALEALAAAEALLGQTAQVEANYKASLAIRKKLQGEDHPAYQTAHEVYLQAVGEAAAIPFQRPTTLTPAQQQRLRVRDQHAAAAEQRRFDGNPQGQYRELEAMLRIEQEVYGPAHEEIALSYEQMANLAERLGERRLARQNWSRLVEVRTKLNGADSWQAADARFHLANLDMFDKLTQQQRAMVRAAIELPYKSRDQASLGGGSNNNAAKALEVSEAVRRVLLDVFGENSIYYANCLDGHAGLYSRQGDEEEAEALYLKAAEITGRIFTKKHPIYLARLARLSMHYRDRAVGFQSKGDFASAEKYWKKRLELQTQRYGEKHWRVIDARLQVERNRRLAKLTKEQVELLRQFDLKLRGLGGIAFDNTRGPQGTVEQSPEKPQLSPTEQWQQAFDVHRQLLGEEDPNAIACLGRLAETFEMPREEAAKCAALRRQLKLCRQTYGADHPQTATVANELGLIFYARGDYVQAEPLLREARRALEATGRTNTPLYPASVNNLAVLYEAMGDNDRAEPLLREVIAMQDLEEPESIDPAEDEFGAVAPKYESLMAEFNVAESLETPTVSVPAPWSPDFAALAKYVNNLALMSLSQRDLPQAESLLRQTLGLLKAGHRDSDGPEYVTGLANLAVVCQMQGDLEQAEALLERVVAIRRTQKWNRPKFAQSLSNLGSVCFARGDLERAGELWNEAYTLRKSILGERHPNTVISLANLAVLDDRSGRPTEAAEKLDRVLEMAAANLQFASAIQSERQQLVMGKTLRGYLDQLLSLSTRTELSPDEIYKHVLRWKGMVSARQRRMRALRHIAAADANSPLAKLYLELDRVNRDLAMRAFADYAYAESSRADLNKTLLRRDELERELASQSSQFAQVVNAKELSVAQLLDYLPPGSALVDLVDYAHTRHDAESGNSAARTRRLAAFVVRPGADTQLLDLGEMAQIEELIDQCREMWTTGRTPPGDDPALELRRLVWEPISRHLADVNTVFISPDGTTSRLAWAALPGEKPGSYLIEDVALAIVPVPQLLADAPPGDAAQSSAPAADGMLLLGNVDFDAQPGGGQGDVPAAAPRSGKLARFDALPGTAQEIDSVGQLFAGTHQQKTPRILKQSAATESAFRELAPGMAYLHLATHGFYAPAEFEPTDKDDFDPLAPQGDATQSVTGWNPGLLSGIVLAGVNHPLEVDADDGILTAAEVADLDLSAARMVVLSACETGLGQIAGGEGALGLQRAFQTAGARSVVSSLWKVDDAATVLLMREFYKNLWERKMSPLAAFREAQLSLLRGKVDTTKLRGLDVIADVPRSAPSDGRLPPRLWAAFVLSGSTQ